MIVFRGYKYYCDKCGSDKLTKAGINRYISGKTTKRFKCKNCGKITSIPKKVKL